MLSQLIRSFACILKVAGSTPCSSFFFIFFYPDVGTRVSGTSGRSTWNDQSFDLLSSKLMLINRCHFEKITTSSLELRIRRVTSRFDNFCLIKISTKTQVSWPPFALKWAFPWAMILALLGLDSFSPIGLISSSALIHASSKLACFKARK